VADVECSRVRAESPGCQLVSTRCASGQPEGDEQLVSSFEPVDDAARSRGSPDEDFSAPADRRVRRCAVRDARASWRGPYRRERCARFRRGRVQGILRGMPRSSRAADSSARSVAAIVGGAHSAHARLRRDDERCLSAATQPARSGRAISRQTRSRCRPSRGGILLEPAIFLAG